MRLKPVIAVAMLWFVRTVPLQTSKGHGHMLVAFIALQRLTTAAKAAVSWLLKLNPQYDT